MDYTAIAVKTKEFLSPEEFTALTDILKEDPAALLEIFQSVPDKKKDAFLESLNAFNQTFVPENEKQDENSLEFNSEFNELSTTLLSFDVQTIKELLVEIQQMKNGNRLAKEFLFDLHITLNSVTYKSILNHLSENVNR